MDKKTADAQYEASLEQLRIERAASDLSFRALGELTGMHEQTLRRYFSGEREIPFPALLEVVSAFGLDFDTFYTRAMARVRN